jgi:hypothetical protein
MKSRQGCTKVFSFDGQGRPIQIFTPDGSLFLLAWLSNKEAVVTAIASDGSFQASTDVDFVAGTTHPVNPPIQKIQRQRNGFQPPSDSFVTILVRRCGKPENFADVSLQVVGPSGGPSLQAALVGDGVYRTWIPTTDASAGQNAEAKCKSLASLLAAIDPRKPQDSALVCAGITDSDRSDDGGSWSACFARNIDCL